MAGTSIVNANDLAGALQQLNDRMEALEKAGGSVPVGFVGHVPGVVPDGWLLCDGSVIDADRYGQLVAYLGTTTLPNLDGRVIVAQSGSFALLGMGGAAAVTLTGAQSGLPAHTHTTTVGFQSANHQHGPSVGTHFVEFAAGGGSTVAAGTNTFPTTTKTSIEDANHSHAVTVNANSAAAASSSHENMPPYLVLVPVIKF